MKQPKRKSFEETSVLAWKLTDESYAEAKKRLSDLWSKGEHPLQLQRKRNAE